MRSWPPFDSFQVFEGAAFCLLLDVSFLEDPLVFAASLGEVSPTRQEKVGQIQGAAGKRLSLGAGLVIREGLAAFGLSEKTVPMRTNAWGKPYLGAEKAYGGSGKLEEEGKIPGRAAGEEGKIPGKAAGGEYPFFNVSHSGTKVLGIFSKREVGCDIQQEGRARDAVIRRFFHPQERAYLESLCEEERRIAFFRLWAIKESYLKAIGTGLATDLSSFCIHLPDRWNPSGYPTGPEGVRFQELDCPGYRMACCIRET